MKRWEKPQILTLNIDQTMDVPIVKPTYYNEKSSNWNVNMDKIQSKETNVPWKVFQNTIANGVKGI